VVAERACRKAFRWCCGPLAPGFLTSFATCGVIVVAICEGESVMKIALVAEQASDHASSRGNSRGAAPVDTGNQALGISTLARALGRLGHEVTIYARKDAPTLSARASLAPGVTIEHLQAGPAARLPADKVLRHLAAFSGHLAQRWRQDSPDVVHSHFWTGGLAALAATRDVRVPVVQTFHTLGAAEQRHYGVLAGGPEARRRLETLIARSVSAVVASSSGEMSELARLGVPRAAIRVVPYGVDTSEFVPDGPVARRSGMPRLLAVAPLTDRSGLDVIVRAMAQVPRCELVIAGGPPRAQLSEDPVHRGLVQLAAKLRVGDRVVFTGKVSRARMPALLRSADLLVHTALYEPFGMVPLEAMACGTPVMAAAGGSCQDAIVDGTTGVLVRPGQPALLARRIRQLLASPMLLQGYGIAAADRARARYSWDRIGRETLAVYQRSLLRWSPSMA
jgi:glycosyltransferase involved in cell wall biosynthesis